ncbi:MAG: type II secretion system F family protein [Anaerolineae bacterium]|nr:type II secretion system F family protein [Anaerolineae bacterium]
MQYGWLIGLGVLGLGVMLVGVLASRFSERSLVERRLGIDPGADRQSASRERKTPVTDALNEALARRGVGTDLATQLARADVKITVGEFLAATVISTVLAGGVAYLIKRDIVITVIALVLGFFVPRFYVSSLRRKRLRAFNNQLGDTINLLVNSLRAGYSVMQGMEAVAGEMDAPISTEFGRVVQEQRLGVSLEGALANMLRRVPSDDLDMMITAINIQREVGGNLAEVLDAISYTIRERVRIKGEIRALTAQSRWSGYIISLVPVVLAVVIYFINPDFMSLMFSERCGWLMLGLAGAGIVAGYFVIDKVVSINV